ncbi:unnamed protein product [Amaranthus hypochondriacus]
MLIKSKVLRFLSHHQKPTNFQSIRTFLDNIEIKFVPDRGLDHAVEKEKDLKFVLNLKNLLKNEPSKSLSLSSIVDNIDKLGFPCRAIDFIRKYPSFFEEYFPGNVAIHPHVRLTQESLNLDAEEQLIYNSEVFRKSAADRLLKLLMLCKMNEIPLKLIDLLKWDLGLPDNYVDILVPEFPDYFKVKKIDYSPKWSKIRLESLLELVCWSDELAVSVVEKRVLKDNSGYQKGMPIEFPMQFSKGFDIDKGMKKWLNEWQRLPYLSPYENGCHLQPNSDMSDKWVAAVLHELLHIFVTKKTERENLLYVGEYLGIKPRVKRALAHHPGIFYRSSKIGTHTMVLREGFKRGLLIETHPLMAMRNKYIHLMHKVKEVNKLKSVSSSSASKQPIVKEGVTEQEKDNGEAPAEEMQFSDSDVDESSDDEEDEMEQDESSRCGRKNGQRGSYEVDEDRSNLKEGRGRRLWKNDLPDESGDDDDDEEEEEEQEEEEKVGRSRAGRQFERKGSAKLTEGWRKPGEVRGRPMRNAPRDKSSGGEERNGSSRGGYTNGRKGSVKVNMDRRKPGEGRGKPSRNISWNVSGSGDGNERVGRSRRGYTNESRGSGKVNVDRRKITVGSGGPRRNAVWNGSGRDNDRERVESSRAGRKFGRNASANKYPVRR